MLPFVQKLIPPNDTLWGNQVSFAGSLMTVIIRQVVLLFISGRLLINNVVVSISCLSSECNDESLAENRVTFRTEKTKSVNESVKFIYMIHLFSLI